MKYYWSLLDQIELRQEISLLPSGPRSVRCASEIDQHDAVLFDDADEQDDANDCDHAQVAVNGHEQHQRTEAGRPQRRDDRDRMDQALIENAEDQVDDEERRDRRGFNPLPQDSGSIFRCVLSR
jgi:hypothetical protein